MKLRFHPLVFAFLLFTRLASGSEQESADDSVVHGTINVALGNKNGMVILTDSMLTNSNGQQLPWPGRKLFKLDDSTVCAVAGFISAPAPGIPDLNTSTSAIIREYVRQSEGQKPQIIVERLRTLASLFRLYLDLISNVRDAGGNPTSSDSYRLQIIVAGFDLDGKPKIGKISLRSTPFLDSLASGIEEASVSEIRDVLVWKLNGMPDIANELLQNPESVPSNPLLHQYSASIQSDAVLHQYAVSLRENHGASLSVKQLLELAKRLAMYTSYVHREVGGSNQVAIISAPHKMELGQLSFSDPARPFLNFKLNIENINYDNVADFDFHGVHQIFVRCAWRGKTQRLPLDGNFFIDNSFENSLLTYNGGSVYFGPTNRVVNSILIVGPLIRPENETVQRLRNSFGWTRIVREFSSGPADF